MMISAATMPRVRSAFVQRASVRSTVGRAPRPTSVRTTRVERRKPARTTKILAAAAIDAETEVSLPRWDLEKWFGFEDPFDSKIDGNMDELSAQCSRFKEAYDGKLETKLYEALVEYERIQENLTSVLSYVMLANDTQLANDDMNKRKAALMQQYSGFSANYLVFFGLQLADMNSTALEKQYEETPELKKYSPFIDETRRTQPYNLPQDIERALSVRSPFVGKGPVVEFYGKELSYLRFDLEGEKINLEVLLSKMSVSKDTEERKALMKVLNNGLKGFERTAALSLNMVAGGWHVENQERGFEELRSQRNLSNNVPDAVVNSLLEAVQTTGTDLCKRYYALKKAVLKSTQGVDTFTWADRNAPLDIGTASETYTWEDAVDIVCDGYSEFSPTMASMFMGMVEEKRIDVPASDGKRGGAYCASAYGCGPFQLLNFNGTQRDVATLAHESGHGCHNILSYEQGCLQFHPPLTLAETASIFGEMIVFRNLLDKAPSKEDRLAMLMSKVDDIINSVVRQCSFDAFEAKVHVARASGALAPEDMCRMWLECVEDYYGAEGEVYDSYDDVSHLWTYVSHFHNVPFYVYSYAFADLVVGSLYGVYQTMETQDDKDAFEANLLDLLRAGGTKDFDIALAPFGLDPSEPSFWEASLKAHLGGLLEEAELLSKELGYYA